MFKKLKSNPLTPFLILTVMGIGLFVATLIRPNMQLQGGLAEAARQEQPNEVLSENQGEDTTEDIHKDLPTNKNPGTSDKQVIGYFTQWDAWKGEEAGLPAQGALTHLNIDLSKYTILNYSFFGVANDGSLHSGDFRDKNIHEESVAQQPAPLLYTDIYSSWDLFILYGELEGVHHINADVASRAKAQGFQVEVDGGTWSNPSWGLENQPLPLPLKKEGGAPGVFELARENNVDVMASIGGWSMCKHFSEVAADPGKRATFVEECVRLMDMGFDGIDLDWEYPGPFEGMNFTGKNADYDNFIILVKEIREAIGEDKLITSCFSADTKKLDGFDWEEVDQYVDFFNFMSYDFNGGFSGIAGHNAPLYGYKGAEAPDFNWDFLYNYLVDKKVNLSKVNMGMAFYGRGVVTDGPGGLNVATVKRDENIQPDGNVSTAADFTNWSAYDGTPNYHHIKEHGLSSSSGWEKYWDDEAKVPYLTKDNFFLSYDDEESIKHKADYIMDKNLAGTIIWTAYGDLEFEGSYTSYGTKLKKWDNVNSPLVDTINQVFGRKPGAGKPAPKEPTKQEKDEVVEPTEAQEEAVVEEPKETKPSNTGSWDSKTVYTGGEIVEFNGSMWLANWWTQGEQPGTTGEWGAWTEQ